MAGPTVNSLTSAVTGELTTRVFSGLIQRYGKDAATRQKLQRLEVLLIKIHSATEASEMRTVKNSWLLRWREQLKEGAQRGDEVLAGFRQRVTDSPDDTGSARSNQKQGEAAASSSSASATPAGALSFTMNSPLSGMAQGIRIATKMLFSSGDGSTERLNTTVGMLEVLSSDIGEFIRLLHFEALAEVDQTPYSTVPSAKVHGPTKNVGEARERKRRKSLNTHSNPLVEPSLSPKPEKAEELSPVFLFCQKGGNNEASLYFDSDRDPPEERQFMLLRDRLDAAFAEICKAVELADSRDMEGLEWLAYWAGILREAKGQGWDVLGSTVNAKEKEESTVECAQEDELGNFVRGLEVLARDVEHFEKLVHLCPAF